MKKILSKKYLQYALLLASGVFLGWLFFHSPREATPHYHETVDASTLWTCSMHPQIQMTSPGKCPLCGMNLIPVARSNEGMDEDAVQLSKEAIQLAGIQTTIVQRQKPSKEIRLYGKVQAPESSLQSQVSQVNGRIEKLLVNSTGVAVHEGQALAVVYSPELLIAQQELIEAAKVKQVQPLIYEAAKQRLRQMKLSEAQIAKIEASASVTSNIEIVANTSGTVIAKRVNTGDYIEKGSVLFDIADLSNVWVMFDAYESDLPLLKEGQKIEFTLQAIPGKTFTGNISLIDPVINPDTRVAGVRISTSNISGQLKPGMFVTGTANTGIGMSKKEIVIPGSAVLWTGERSVVYVKEPNSESPVFKMREITLGPSLGDDFIVYRGVTEGEEIVTNGTFSVDAAAQLEGKPSMMNKDVSMQDTHGN